MLLLGAAGVWGLWAIYGGESASVPAADRPREDAPTIETTEPITEAPTEAATSEPTEEVTEAPTEPEPAILDLDPYYWGIGADHEYSRDQFASITFVDSVKDAGADAWDASKAKNGSILAWTAPSQYAEGLLDLYIGSNEQMYAGDALMLREYVHLQKLSLGGLLDTSGTKEFDRAFEYTGMLSPVPLELDLTGLDVSAATSMYHMFAGCSTLESVNLTDWDVSGVTNCVEMFFGCRNLTRLEIAGWQLAPDCQTMRMIDECNSLTNTQEIVNALGLDWKPAPTFPGKRVTELTTEELYYAASLVTAAGPHTTETFEGDIGEECPEYSNLDLDHDGKRDYIQRSMEGTKYTLHMGSGQVLPLDGIEEIVTQYTTFSFQDLNGSGQDDILAVTVYHSSAGSYSSFQLYTDSSGTYRRQVMPDAKLYMEDLKNDYVQLSFPYSGYKEIIPFNYTAMMNKWFAEEGGNAFHYYFSEEATDGRTDDFLIQDVKVDGRKLIVMYNFLAKYTASVTRNPIAVIWRMEPGGYFVVERVGTDVVKDYWLT